MLYLALGCQDRRNSGDACNSDRAGESMVMLKVRRKVVMMRMFKDDDKNEVGSDGDHGD